MTETPSAEPTHRGRPRKDRPAGKRITYTFELDGPEQRAKLDALGGANWLRERIERAKLPAQCPAEA